MVFWVTVAINRAALAWLATPGGTEFANQLLEEWLK